MSLQKDEWIASYDDSIIYDWDVVWLASVGENSPLEFIEAILSMERDGSSLMKMKGPILKEELENWVRGNAMRWNSIPANCVPERIVKAAIDVAAHAIASSLCNMQAGDLKLGIPAGSSRIGTETSLSNLGSKIGLEAGQPRLTVPCCIFPHASSSIQDLAICRDGLEAGWVVLWKQTTLQRGALQVNILRESIER